MTSVRADAAFLGRGKAGGMTTRESMPAAWATPYDLFDEQRTTPTKATTDNGAHHTTSSSGSGGRSSTTAADVVNVRGIKIAGWVIETHRGSIADSKTIDELSDRWGIPLPEMPFDKNRLVIRYEGGPSASSSSSSHSSSQPSSWEYTFDGMSALRSVEGVQQTSALDGIDFLAAQSSDAGVRQRHGALGHKPTKQSKRVQVSYADEWGKKREQQALDLSSKQAVDDTDTVGADGSSSSNFGADVLMAAASGTIATARDYDWTYSSTWPGALSSSSSVAFIAAQDPQRDRIPVERLGPPTTPGTKAEPILFFDDVILYEDELGDNGASMLSVKIRVMPTGFLVLQRFFLRVDNVLFRVFDTRMYVGFYAEDVHMHNERLTQTPSVSGEGSHLSTTNDFARLSLGTPRRANAHAPKSPSPPEPASPLRVIRECCGFQEPYVAIRARLPPYKPNDLSPLTDPGWVTQQITQMAEDRTRKGSSHTMYPGTMVSVQHSDPTRPAVLPNSAAPGQESNRILGEVTDANATIASDDRWEGEGRRVDVALLV